MTWKEYENKVHDYFLKKFPDAKFLRNIKLLGKLSKTKREIDILIESSIAGYPIQIALECKNWNKKIDVADVGSFIDKITDVGISKGIMISAKGYTKPAYERASNHFATQLQVINFETLPPNCDFWAIAARYDFGALIIPPNGWLVDGNVHEDWKMQMLCYMHPFEMTIEEASSNRQFMYFQIFPILEGHNMKVEFKRQDEVVKNLYPKSVIEYWQDNYGGQEITYRRIGYVERNYSEFTAGFDLEGYYVFCVSLAPFEWTINDKLRLEFVMKNMEVWKLFNLPKDNPMMAWQAMVNKFAKKPDDKSFNVHPDKSHE